MITSDSVFYNLYCHKVNTNYQGIKEGLRNSDSLFRASGCLEIIPGMAVMFMIPAFRLMDQRFGEALDVKSEVQ
jgi:hypothetical protein